MKVAILQNEFDDNYLNWINACNKFNIEYKLIDLVSENWLDQVKNEDFDVYLACPSGRESLYKKMYDERIYIIDKVLNRFVYPSFDEISIHENKRYLSYWLEANNINHPVTRIFYNKKEAIVFAKECELPQVGKFNIGASGKGVRIIREKQELLSYIDKAFSTGLTQSWGPNLKMGGYYGRIKNLIKNPGWIIKRLKAYEKNFNEKQKGFVLLQEYIPHDYEWRVVKIGESYFGHQKVKQGDKSSGTKGIDYVSPPYKLLSFVRDLCTRFEFNSMAVDLFEDGKGGFLVNEMQCIFGHVQDYICAKDNIPGRFKLDNNLSWVFEEGNFNTNLSYDLRFQNVLQLFKDKEI